MEPPTEALLRANPQHGVEVFLESPVESYERSMRPKEVLEFLTAAGGSGCMSNDNDTPLLRYLEAPRVSSISPVVVHSGTVITVTGTHFEHNPDLSVNVGNIIVSSSKLIRLSKTMFRFVSALY